jgi:replicative superfamily II helicase
MVNFAELRTQKKKGPPHEPIEIFRRLPKPPGINDLFTSQAEILDAWHKKRTQKDMVLKLHTGGGKTLVGLLMAQSVINETGEPVLYLAPTTQLVKQTLEKAKAVGIPAVGYETGKGPLNEDFLNGKALMVATYKALFHGRSKFGVRGSSTPPVRVGAVVLDDAHVAFSVVRETFTLSVEAKNNKTRYDALTTLFRKSFRDIDRVGTFDDTISGLSSGVIEVPYGAWHEQLDTVREHLRQDAELYKYEWPLLRDNLHLCHALISRTAFTITSVLPLVHQFPTFFEAPRRIYMSATIADDSDIVSTFDAAPALVSDALTSRSLAGVSERMILIPALMPFQFEVRPAVDKLLQWATATKGLGAVVLVPSDASALKWNNVANVAKGPVEVQALVDALQAGTWRGPGAFSNRYDGLDLPGDSCRLLVMEGLPSGTSDYELFRASALYGGATFSRMLAQRIEQGIGRGARGSGDHCVVLLMGPDLAGWIAKEANFKLLTSATRVQLDMGATVSKAVNDINDLAVTIDKSFSRDSAWVGYHAETLAEEIGPESSEPKRFDEASTIRKAFNLWQDGYHEKAISKIDKLLDTGSGLDNQTKGWLQQFAARIASHWGQPERAEDLQQQAFANNRNLFRPKVPAPYRATVAPGEQASSIAKELSSYRMRRGLMQRFEDAVSVLHPGASAAQFEGALTELGQMLGLVAERHDLNGVGPDVVWLLPDAVGWVIEAKSRKLEKNAMNKEEHGQLLIAEEWFRLQYPGFSSVRVSVHPHNKATRAAVAGGSYALTYHGLAKLVADARVFLARLCESQLTSADLVIQCANELNRSALKAERLTSNYLVPFDSDGAE